MLYKSVLYISDQHAPYGHPDTYKFLKALKQKYKPQLIINGGDEIDGAAISFHDKNPDLMSPGDELASAIEKMQGLFHLFPKMVLLDSNHGSLVYRKGKWAGLPRHVFKSYREILGAPKNWHWHDEYIYKLSNGQSVYNCHSRGSDVLKVSHQVGMNTVQFHHHSQFEIRYWKSPSGLYFAVTAGCLADLKSAAFDYGKLSLKRPIEGTVVILNGHPLLQPMLLDSRGRWTKKLV